MVVRVRGVWETLSGSRLCYLAGGWCGFAGSRVRGFAGSRLRYPAGVVVRVRGVWETLSGSRLRYLAGGCAGLRVCGCAGLRVLGCVIRLVWLCGCAGFGQRYPAGVVVRVRGVRATLSGSRLRYLAGGCAGLRGSGT